MSALQRVRLNAVRCRNAIFLVKVGICFPGNLPLKFLVKAAMQADRDGLDSVWMVEYFRDAFTAITAFALNTKRIGVGTGIVSIFSRTPTITAMTIAGIDELSDGRAILGLGTGLPSWIENQGVRFEKAKQRMREYVTIVRKALAGETTNFSGKVFDIKNFQLFGPKRRSLPIHVAAVGPGMIEVAGEVGDYCYLGALNSPEYVRFARKMLNETANKFGRKPREIGLSCNLMCSVAKDAGTAKKLVKPTLAFYCSLYYYNPVLKISGLTEEAEKVKRAYDAGDTMKAIGLVTDRLIDSLTLTGSPSECRRKIEEYGEAGIDLVNLYPAHHGATEDLVALVENAIKTFAEMK